MFRPLLFVIIFLGFVFSRVWGETLNAPTPVLMFPQLDAQKIGNLNQGAKISILRESGEWIFVETREKEKNLKGWILRSMVSNELESSTTQSKSGISLADRKGKAEEPRDPKALSSDPSSAFVFPTALQQPKGTFAAKGTYFFSWNFEYTMSDYAAVGLTTLVPIGVVGFAPNFKLTTSLTPNFHLGMVGAGGFIASLFSTRGNNMGSFFLGGGLATVGDSERAITFGTYIAGGQAGDSSYGHVLLLNANAFTRFTRSIKGIVDGVVPVANHRRNVFADWGAILYGVRIGGNELYGDVGFLAPIYANAGKFYRYLPLGVPFVSLSVIF